MPGDHPVIIETYEPQLTGRVSEGDKVFVTLVDGSVRVLK